ncbi:MAG: sodium-dependent bicarbonate transport family permease, partial [Burkholderiaceae bacterium]
MVAVAAVMEGPAIISALWLLSRGNAQAQHVAGQEPRRMDADLWREILLNSSIVLLIGAFLIGLVTGEKGMQEIESFIVTPFKGVLCLFLLDMGLLAGRGLRNTRGKLSFGLLVFGMLMPVIGSLVGLISAMAIGLSVGGAMLLMVLAASASYIAVPAAMRVALPEADPGIYLTLSLGVTFPFNLTIGIPLYLALANAFLG